MKLDKIITAAAGALLLGVSGWLLNTTLAVQAELIEARKDLEVVKETMSKVYEDNCPYCVHAAHSSMKDHPILAPIIRNAHTHTQGGEVIFLNK